MSTTEQIYNQFKKSKNFLLIADVTNIDDQMLKEVLIDYIVDEYSNTPILDDDEYFNDLYNELLKHCENDFITANLGIKNNEE